MWIFVTDHASLFLTRIPTVWQVIENIIGKIVFRRVANFVYRRKVGTGGGSAEQLFIVHGVSGHPVQCTLPGNIYF